MKNNNRGINAWKTYGFRNTCRYCVTVEAKRMRNEKKRKENITECEQYRELQSTDND